MNRREFLISTAVTGAAMAFLPRLAQAQAAPEVTEISLGFGLDPVFAPHIVAMQKGWLEEAGFTSVTTTSFTAGALAGEALLAGEIQLWTPGNLPPISMAHTSIPVVVLGTNCIAADADRLVARPEANIKAPEDLYNARIGLLAGSTASVTLSQLARHYGLDESRLQVVNMPPPEQLAALNAGEIDAFLCWQPWGHNALSSGAVLVHSGTTSGFEQNEGEEVQISATRSIFVASQDFVRENPNATRALMGALVRGQSYVSDPANREEVLSLVSAETGQEQEVVEAIWDQYVFDPTFDERYVADMQTMTDYLSSSGRIEEAMDPLSYTYTEPAAEAGVTVEVAGTWQP